MRQCRITNGLVINLDKLSGIRLANKTESSKPYGVYLLVDGHEYYATAFSNQEGRKDFVGKLMKAWGNDKSAVNDSPAAVD